MSESQQYLREDEYKILNISSLSFQWVREVVLKGNNTPWVYARSVILSNGLLKKDPENLKNIGKQPLGSILFDAKKFSEISNGSEGLPQRTSSFSMPIALFVGKKVLFRKQDIYDFSARGFFVNLLGIIPK